MLQIKALARIPGTLPLTVLLWSLSSRIHLELLNISLAMCLHQASLRQQLNSHLSALASWNGTAVLQPRKGEAQKIPRDHPEKLISVEQDQKTVSEDHKGHADVQHRKLWRVYFFPRMISLFFFFFLQTRWTCLWGSQEGRVSGLCSSIAAKGTTHMLSRQSTTHCLSRKILICNAGLLQKHIEWEPGSWWWLHVRKNI